MHMGISMRIIAIIMVQRLRIMRHISFKADNTFCMITQANMLVKVKSSVK